MKYTFIEYLAACEGADFDVIESSNLAWAERYVMSLSESIVEQKVHNGDCTNLPCTCVYCNLERLLSDYYNYYFKEQHDS